MNKAISLLKENLNKKTIVVATSGGPDSMTLLYLVNNLKEELNLKIICAFVNHKMRKESDDEEIMVKKYCQNNDIIFEAYTIKSYNDDNFHNDARLKRYNFFEKCINKYKAKFLLTAHHGDDLMETILMRLVRGSSFKGYSGFSLKQKRKNYTILRPLINYTKKEIEDYADKNKIPYMIDKSNEKDSYTRNRFRKYLLPPLKKEEKCVHDKFYKFSNTIKLYDEYINKEVDKYYDKVFINSKLNIDKFNSLDKLMKIKIIEKLLENIYQEDLMNINDKHIDEILNIVKSKKANSSINLPNNKIVVKSYKELYIIDNKEENTYEYELDEFVTLPNGKTIKKINKTNNNSNNICRLSSLDIKLPLYIRNKKQGDKIEIKGLKGSKKIKDIFIDEKVPLKQRNSYPVLVDSDNKILWLPGLKKSKFDKPKEEKCDIILEYI